jgi:hypothetical protein
VGAGAKLDHELRRVEPHRLANLSPVGIALLQYRRQLIEGRNRIAPLAGNGIRTEGGSAMPPVLSLPF